MSEWEDLAGINPQEYAQDLMQGTQEALGLIQKEQQQQRKAKANKEGKKHKKGGSEEETDAEGDTENTRRLNPADLAKEALTRAYHKARNFGSSTAIVGVLDGDSGVFGAFMHARRIYFRSTL